MTGSVLSVGMPVVNGRQAKSAGTYFTAAEVVRFSPDNLTIGFGEKLEVKTDSSTLT